MREGWTYKDIETCLRKVPKAKQVQTSEYDKGSKYPIISQEDKLISGYCDDESMLFRIEKPVVIFGDHTRTLKYINFNFVVGADGVKILDTIEELDAKFLYYYLKWYNVPSLGYSRHYKLLKEIKVPLPPKSQQEALVAELDEINSLLALKREQLQKYDNLAQSLFYEMFGDPVENEKGWEVKELNNCVEEMFLGPFGSALKVECYVPEDKAYAMVYEQKHAIQGRLDLEKHFISKEKFDSLSRFEVLPGDFIMSCRGTIGKIYQLPNNASRGIIHPSLMKIRIKEDVYSPMYFIFMLRKIVANETTNGNCVQMAITAKELGRKHLPLPPLPLQQQFASRIEQIESQKQQVQAAIEKLETLLASRMQYWFD